MSTPRFGPGLPWAHPAFAELLDALCDAYDSVDKIKFLARSTPGMHTVINRVTWGGNGGVMRVWSDLLEEADRNGKARDLFAKVGSDPAVERWHEKLAGLLAQLKDDRPGVTTKPVTTDLRLQERAQGILGEMRGALDELLAEIHPLPRENELVLLLWAAAGDVGPIQVVDLSNIHTLIDVLDRRMRGGDIMPPVLAFLEYLAAHSDRRKDLQAFVDRVSKHHRVPPEEHKRVRRCAEDSILDVDRISVYVSIDDSDPEGLRPEVVVYRTDTVASFKQGTDRTYRLEIIRNEVERLIADIEPLLRGMPRSELRFEFVLPWDMFNFPVDEWHRADGLALGMHSQVVIRSLDRHREPIDENSWKERSHRLRDGRGLAPEQLVRDLREGIEVRRGLLREDLVVCLALPTPYSPPKSWRESNHLLSAIKCGLPSALWTRSDWCDSGVLLKLALDAAKDERLGELPREVLSLRQKSCGRCKNGVECSVTLFWDEYDACPNKTRALRAPAYRGGSS